MIQRMALDGKQLSTEVMLPPILDEVLGKGFIPRGLVDLDEETGMVKVAVTAKKTQFMKLGKLLKKVGEHEEVCSKLSGKLKATLLALKGAELEFTSDGDEAYDVYSEGPYSCMKNMEAVRCYDSDDVAIAYVRIEDRVVARTVVCINEEIGLQYICIYGFEMLLKPLLERAGYVEGSLDGCKLALIEEYGKILCPYLDCGSNVSVGDRWLEVDSCGEYSARDTSGFLGEECGHCEEMFSEDSLSYSEHSEVSLCESCFHDCHELVDGTYYHTDSREIVETRGGDWIMADEACYSETLNGYMHEDDCTYSDYSEDYYYKDDVVMAITNVDYPEGEPCCKDDCTLYNHKWIHDDIIDEYTQLDLLED
jgi:hypothetical protein